MGDVVTLMTDNLTGTAARVYAALKEDIISGAIPPGGAIHEAATASRFRVSKSPVRDALVMLRAEGYVQAIPHRAYVASDVSLRDFNEVFAVRGLLESEAASLAARHATPQVVAHLDDLVHAGRIAEAAANYQEYVRLNRDFHMTIAVASGNTLLRRLIEQSLDRAERAIALGVRHRPQPHSIYEEAGGIIAAIRAGNSTGAAQAMREHIERTRRRLLALSERGG
jgi:DNA-binding GntR family transcriptional regulator